jgi:hypothetical protein
MQRTRRRYAKQVFCMAATFQLVDQTVRAACQVQLADSPLQRCSTLHFTLQRPLHASALYFGDSADLQLLVLGRHVRQTKGQCMLEEGTDGQKQS